MNKITASTRYSICIGKQGEYGSTQVEFYKSGEFSDWDVALYVKREADEEAYEVTLTEDSPRLIWTVSATDTENVGTLTAELRYTNDDDGLYITKTYNFYVIEGLGTPVTPT